MYCFSGENKWFWEEMDEREERNYTFCSKCVVFGGKDTMYCALMLQKKSFYYVPPLDSGNGRGYNTKVKSCAEEEYLFVRAAERGRLVRALAGEQRRSLPSSAPEL